MPGLGNAENLPGSSEACLRFDADLAAYLEGEDRPGVTVHAADCVSCAAVLADLDTIRSTAVQLQTAEPPETLWRGVRSALIQEGIIRTSHPSEACLRFQTDLIESLEIEARPDMAAHAAECEFCGVLLADLQAVRSAAKDLEAVEPPARLWANIRSALAEEGVIRAPRRRRWLWPAWTLQPMPAAALAGLVLIGSLSVGRWFGPSVDREGFATATMVDPGVQTSVQEMEGAFRARTAGVDPIIMAALRKDLESLDVEIRECRASVESRPDDGLAREYLAAAYTEKAQILASALDLDNH